MDFDIKTGVVWIEHVEIHLERNESELESALNRIPARNTPILT